MYNVKCMTRRMAAACKTGKPSRESGRKKGLVPPTWAKSCAKNARSYKNNERYEEWSNKCDGSKIKWKAS